MRLPNRLWPARGVSWPLALILLAYVVLGVAYAVANPILESPDEADHFRYVRDLAERRALPVASTTERSEAHQPPLAYAVLAAATGWLPAPDRDALTRRNPWWGYEQGSVGRDNKNQYLHTPATSPRSSPAARAALAARLVNLAFGALGIIVAYRLALLAFAGSHGLAAAATGLGSLFPQFLFIQASVNNDALLVSLCQLVLLMLAWIARPGSSPFPRHPSPFTLHPSPFPRHPSPVTVPLLLAWIAQSGATSPRLILVGVAIALAVLTKLTALLLLPLVPVALIAAHSRLDPRRLPKELLIVGATIALLTGWWFLRNLILYGEPTGLAIMQQSWQTLRPTPLPPAELLALLPNVERSFWGSFGWGNVPMPPSVYVALRVLPILGALGVCWTLGRRLVRKPQGPGPGAGEHYVAAGPSGPIAIWLLLAAWPALNAAALLRVMQTESLKDMGRYLFPSAGALACLVVLGLSRLLTSRTRFIPGFALPPAIAGLSTWALLFVLVPAYARPPVVADPGRVVPERRLDYTFGDDVLLIGADVSPARIAPGDKLAVTLYWQARRDLDRDYAVYVHVDPLGGGLRVGQRDSFPGAGNWPTSNWRRGDVVVDSYQVPLTHPWPAPSVLSIRAGLFDPETRERPRVAAAGRPVLDEPLVAEVAAPALKAIPPTATPVPAAEGDFADRIRLQAFGVAQDSSRERVDVTLYWQALSQLERTHTVFVHLVDAEGRLLAQHDGQPVGNAYPTPFWLPGETVPDLHAISLPRPLPSGRYHLRIGLYDTATQQRLDRTGGEGADRTSFFSVDLPPVP